jgi:hypothetical protein
VHSALEVKDGPVVRDVSVSDELITNDFEALFAVEVQGR